MAYEYITKYTSPDQSPGRPYGPPDHIAIHHWGAFGQKFDNVVAWLIKKDGNYSSAHYVVEAGKVACIVDPDDRAWHAGSKSNPRGIGIECRPECTAEDLETVAELIAELRRIYGNLPLQMHKDFMPTACPGRWEAQMANLDKRAREIAGGATPAAAKPAAKSIETLAREVIAGKHGNGEARKKSLGASYGAVQARVNQILAEKTKSPAAAKPAGKSIETLAREVIAGKHGNGEARKKSLGASYGAVQARVNEILRGN